MVDESLDTGDQSADASLPRERNAAATHQVAPPGEHADKNPNVGVDEPDGTSGPLPTDRLELAPVANDPPAAEGDPEDVEFGGPASGKSGQQDDEIEDEYDSFEGEVEPLEQEVDEEEPSVESEKQWFILKVQSNRENSICDALARRVKVAGFDSFFGEIIVPTEDVAEFKNGKRRVVKRKLYPGYIVIHMVLNDETWFLVRDTPGIGDFTGAAGKPTPMLPEEVDRIVKSAHPEEEGPETIKTAIPFKMSDRVRIKEGTFENFEGDVEGIDEANGRVTVMINIFGRSTPVELEHWQIESV